MNLSEGIRRMGFRRWYERQLLESHLFFVSGFLCLIAVMASLEDFSLQLPGWETLLRFFAIAAGSLGFLWTTRRYLVMLRLALSVAARSICEKCSTYGRFEVSDARCRPAASGATDWRACSRAGQDLGLAVIIEVGRPNRDAGRGRLIVGEKAVQHRCVRVECTVGDGLAVENFNVGAAR